MRDKFNNLTCNFILPDLKERIRWLSDPSRRLGYILDAELRMVNDLISFIQAIEVSGDSIELSRFSLGVITGVGLTYNLEEYLFVPFCAGKIVKYDETDWSMPYKTYREVLSCSNQLKKYAVVTYGQALKSQGYVSVESGRNGNTSDYSRIISFDELSPPVLRDGGKTAIFKEPRDKFTSLKLRTILGR